MEDGDGSGSPKSAEVSAASSRWRARAQKLAAPLIPRALRILPWFSLATGVLGALFMDRSPDSAWLVLVAALGGWAVLFLFAFLHNIDVESLSSQQRTLARVGQVTTLIALQSLMQQNLFFALPFYVLSSTWLFSHAVFLFALGAACIVTLWDPVYERVIARASMRVLLQLFSTFAACNAILPALGLSNRASLVVSALFASCGAPLEILVHASPESRKRRALVVGLISAVALPFLVSTVFARFIPPSPLRLLDGAVGTTLADKWVQDPTSTFDRVPPQLVCATRVSAPRGVRDEIVHVWWKNGRVVDRVPVRIEGGSETGFRTFSRKQQLTKDPVGVWACVVETVTGQRLGAVRVEIRGPTDTAGP